MPNWMEGSLKLRGNSENILRFFKEGLTSYVGHWTENNEYENIPVEKEKWLEIIDNGNDTEVYLNPVDSAWIHVDNTKRAFIDGRYSIIFNNVPKNAIAVTDIRQAWDFRTDEWVEIANRFQVDIMLYGIESGIGFMHEVFIGYNGDLKREIIKNKTISFSDYEAFKWNCPFPWMGG